MSEIIKNRSEIVFIYDVRNANPNGDVEENRPRIDEDTGINIVTDVRLKRTIRDYLYKHRNQEIFVREIEYEPGKIQDAKLRAEDFLFDISGNKISKDDIEKQIKSQINSQKKDIEPSKLLQEMKKIIDTNIKKMCIDVRLFGVTLPVEWDNKNKSSITYTGPVQFKIGRSLHKVGEPIFIRGTGAFASGKNSEQKTFREEYILPYSLICFYGIINENAAKDTGLTNEDVELLIEGMWNGTKNLITRSKVGQMPRLLLQVVYKENNYHIGDLDKKIKLISNKKDEELREIAEIRLDLTELAKVLEKNKNKILKVRYLKDDDLQIVKDGNPMEIDTLVDGVEFEKINLKTY
ncbi:MAG TPA: type I-B CRISPR-associated protein Cas7/Csh2 [bacterium]|nr:type I-B CRISPR-associated protein Cas7/Csh2 [bacterium]HPP29787.1 type I-B CRISPR-associated protein Cas7/Csh2 [bacterium]